jgi:hypothetical protein
MRALKPASRLMTKALLNDLNGPVVLRWLFS